MIPWRIIFGELILGVGAALAVGTGFALLRYRQTGSFPNQDEGEQASVPTAWVKLVLGVVLAVWGFATLDTAGLF